MGMTKDDWKQERRNKIRVRNGLASSYLIKKPFLDETPFHPKEPRECSMDSEKMAILESIQKLDHIQEYLLII